MLQPHLSLPPRHQIPLTTGLDADTFYTSSYIGVLPDDIFQEFYSPYAICALPIVLSENPIPLLDDDTTRRAISTFDRNTTVDSHKVGVIYIGDGQSSESEILSNVMGSPDYTSFITSLGTLIRLKGANFNTQGLDREFDTDGEFAIAWRDRVTELVFHITTMMPTNLDQDPTGTAKKKHTGNDFVNIVWNNSGLPFKFDTFPSAFNFVYIVITPTARASFLDTRTKVTADDTASVDVKSTISSNAPTMSDEGPANSASQRTGTRTLHNYFYRVEVLSAPGFPDISPASNAKIISGKALPDFIRFVALNASVFSFVWANREGGDHVSSWRNRLREIKRLREKYLAKAQSQSSPEPRSRPPSTPLSGGERNSVIGAMSGLIGMGGDRRPTPSMRDSGIAAAKRTSAMTVMSEDNTSRSSLLSSAGPDERRGSQ